MPDSLGIQLPSKLPQNSNLPSDQKIFTPMEVLDRPLRISDEPLEISRDLNLSESIGVHIARDEDSMLNYALQEDSKHVIILTGGPGAGKSESIKNALFYCRNIGYSTFVFIKNFFKEGDELSLELLKDKDNLVIVWDNLHTKNSSFVNATIDRISDICQGKKFKIIGATRNKNLNPEYYFIDLKYFTKVKELVNECKSFYDVTISDNAFDAVLKRIISITDGTPYYVISLFKMNAEENFTEDFLAILPDNVLSLWKSYINESITSKRLDSNHVAVFRSIGLLSHTSKTSIIDYGSIDKIFPSVFKGAGDLDLLLKDLQEQMFVSKANNSGEEFIVHDSHIEALEELFPIKIEHVERFLVIEDRMEHLSIFMGWAGNLEHWYMMELICSRMIELHPHNTTALFQKGRAIFNQGRFVEAMEYYDQVISLDMDDVGWALWGKAVIYYEKGQFAESLDCYDKAIKYLPDKSEVWQGKSQLLFELKRYEDALVFVEQALKINPNNGSAWGVKGDILDKLGRKKEAEMCLKKSKDLFMSNSE